MMDTIESEQGLLKQAKARGLDMPPDHGKAERLRTIQREGIFRKRHMTFDAVEQFINEARDGR